jgi:hypothetical protein
MMGRCRCKHFDLGLVGLVKMILARLACGAARGRAGQAGKKLRGRCAHDVKRTPPRSRCSFSSSAEFPWHRTRRTGFPTRARATFESDKVGRVPFARRGGPGRAGEGRAAEYA